MGHDSELEWSVECILVHLSFVILYLSDREILGIFGINFGTDARTHLVSRLFDF